MPLFSSRKKSSSADRTKEAAAALQCEAEGDRVAATSVPPVDITLGATSMQFGDGEWSVVDGGATEAGEAAPLKSGVPIAGALASASADELRKLRDENTGLRGEVNMLKFKIELLVDMLTVANLDCDKLADDVDR